MSEIMVGEFAQPNETMALASVRFLKKYVITEENGDRLAAIVQSKLAGKKFLKFIPIPAFLIAAAIDNFFPEKALDLITHLMIEKGLLAEEELRKLDSPFIQD